MARLCSTHLCWSGTNAGREAGQADFRYVLDACELNTGNHVLDDSVRNTAPVDDKIDDSLLQVVVVATLDRVLDMRAEHVLDVSGGEGIDAPAWVLVFIRGEIQQAIPRVETVALMRPVYSPRILVVAKPPKKSVHRSRKYAARSLIRVDIECTWE
jgi:hypothetical protein